MKSGRCPKCQASAVRQRHNVLYAQNPGLRPDASIVIGISTLTASAELTAYICTACGYIESYLTDAHKLHVIAEKWDRVP